MEGTREVATETEEEMADETADGATGVEGVALAARESRKVFLVGLKTFSLRMATLGELEGDEGAPARGAAALG